MKLFAHQSSYPKINAQCNLSGIASYVDDQMLRYHKARVLSTYTSDNGLLFSLVESVALDPNGYERGFRPVIFNIFGTILSHNNLENCFKSSAAAEKSMWAELNKLDAKALTIEAINRRKTDVLINRRKTDVLNELDRMLEKVKAL